MRAPALVVECQGHTPSALQVPEPRAGVIRIEEGRDETRKQCSIEHARETCCLDPSALALCAGSFAQDAPGPSDKKVTYSPDPQQTFPNRVFFGDTHLHTSYSTDAGMIGNTLGPEEAYRFARGETVKSSPGLPARLNRPLDFLVVSDHAENLGLAPMIAESNPELLKTEFGRKLHDLVKAGKGERRTTFGVWC